MSENRFAAIDAEIRASRRPTGAEVTMPHHLPSMPQDAALREQLGQSGPNPEPAAPAGPPSTVEEAFADFARAQGCREPEDLAALARVKGQLEAFKFEDGRIQGDARAVLAGLKTTFPHLFERQRYAGSGGVAVTKTEPKLDKNEALRLMIQSQMRPSDDRW